MRTPPKILVLYTSVSRRKRGMLKPSISDTKKVRRPRPKTQYVLPQAPPIRNLYAQPIFPHVQNYKPLAPFPCTPSQQTCCERPIPCPISSSPKYKIQEAKPYPPKNLVCNLHLLRMKGKTESVVSSRISPLRQHQHQHQRLMLVRMETTAMAMRPNALCITVLYPIRIFNRDHPTT